MRATIVLVIAAAVLSCCGCGGGDRRVDPTPHLLVFLKSDDFTDRHSAAQELAEMGAIPEDALPDLFVVLHNAKEDDRVRIEVVKALGNQKELAPQVVPELLKQSDIETSTPVRDAIQQALTDLDAEHVPVHMPDEGS